MFIYKITNLVNNKIYIGKVYNKTIYDRFNRHIKAAVKNNSKLYLHKAIRKHGKDNFIIEQIDTANNLDELNNKEKYWIKFYNSTNDKFGYNLTIGGDGGNTYLNKSTEELEKIKHKISKANSGINNANSRQIKAYNYKTKETIIFDTLNDAQKFFNLKTKGPFNCNQKSLYKNVWEFANIDDNFKYNIPIHDPSTKHGIKVKLLNKINNETHVFNSISKLCKFLNCKPKPITSLNRIFVDKYEIIKL